MRRTLQIVSLSVEIVPWASMEFLGWQAGSGGREQHVSADVTVGRMRVYTDMRMQACMFAGLQNVRACHVGVFGISQPWRLGYQPVRLLAAGMQTPDACQWGVPCRDARTAAQLPTSAAAPHATAPRKRGALQRLFCG